jgi:hypothetical protein
MIAGHRITIELEPYDGAYEACIDVLRLLTPNVRRWTYQALDEKGVPMWTPPERESEPSS